MLTGVEFSWCPIEYYINNSLWIQKQELILQISDNKFSSASLTDMRLIMFLIELEEEYNDI